LKNKYSFDEVYWFDVPNGKVFKIKFKGGVICPKDQLVAV
jgi:hypothetical protein